MDIATSLKSFEVLLSAVIILGGVGTCLIFFTHKLLSSSASRLRKLVSAGATVCLLMLFFYTTLIVTQRAIAVPKLLTSSPKSGGILDPSAPNIIVRLNAPVLYRSLRVYIYPETTFTIVPNGYLWNAAPAGASFTIKPHTTLPPGEKYMVYISNIEGPLTRGFGGEQLLEFENPDIHISKINIPEKSTDVPTTQSFTYTFDRSMAAAEEWSVLMDPEHDMNVVRTNETTLEVSPVTPLNQSTDYTLTLIQTPMLLVQKTQKEMTRLEPRQKHMVHLSTVHAVFIKSVDIQGKNFRPDSDFHIGFDQPMDRRSVETNITISPAASLIHKWSDNDSSLTISHPVFPNDTDYTVTLKSGIRTASGGKLEADTIYAFHTAGPIQVVDIQPAHQATGVSPASIIRVAFDQDITLLAADFFRIDPPVTGRISVLGNSMEWKPDNSLRANTNYTITLAQRLPSAYGLPMTEQKIYSFTTSPIQTVLAVPFYRQQSLFTCNIAAARMLLAYRSIDTSEKDIIHSIGLGGKRGSGNPNLGYIDDYGTYWPAILRGITAHRPARMLTAGSLTEILTEIDRGNPVMTWGQNGWSDPHAISWTATDGTYIDAINGMHSTVVRGYQGSVNNPTLIYVNDPWRGQYTLTPTEFLRRWNYIGQALVIE